ncbi:MAG: DMT family transporter [Candidatus Krumholzibacteriia bacterium]
MGEIFAMTCALMWAFAVVLFRRSGETIPPLALNLFRVGLSSAAFLLTLAVLREPLFRPAPLGDYLILAASGVIAIALSDTLFHMSLNRVGAGVNAVVDTLYSPFTVVMAFLMLGERLSPLDLVGMVFIVTGVIIATRVKLPPGVTRRTLIMGILLGVGAMATLSFGIVLAKPVLERHDVVWTTTIRQLASLIVLVPAALLGPGGRRNFRVFRPDRSWRFSAPGTLMGSYLALLFWIGGMKYTSAGTAAILNQTSTIYLLILASVILKEPFTRRKAVAAGLALCGILLVLRPGS